MTGRGRESLIYHLFLENGIIIEAALSASQNYPTLSPHRHIADSTIDLSIMFAQSSRSRSQSMPYSYLVRVTHANSALATVGREDARNSATKNSPASAFLRVLRSTRCLIYNETICTMTAPREPATLAFIYTELVYRKITHT